jgi:choline dehydrogenase
MSSMNVSQICPDVSVLLLEAGGSDDVPSVMEAGQWPLNLGSDRDCAFQAQSNPHLNGRSIPENMGKVLGGGSSINVMGWARGHKNDLNYFASEAGDSAWSYDSLTSVEWPRRLVKEPWFCDNDY